MDARMTEPNCGRCGEPAKGYATIGEQRYCHDEPDPTCYMLASWELFNNGVHLVEVVEQRFEGDDLLEIMERGDPKNESLLQDD